MAPKTPSRKFLAEELSGFAANPSSFDPTSITGIGYSNVLDTFYPDQGQRQLLIDLLSDPLGPGRPERLRGHMTSSADSGLLPDCTGAGVISAAVQGTSLPDRDAGPSRAAPVGLG